MTGKEKGFLQRADAHIFLANDQITEEITPGDVSSSLMYGTARFNAWIAATSFESSEDMAAERSVAVEYFVKEYKKMLEQHLDNHIETFDFSKNTQ